MIQTVKNITTTVTGMVLLALGLGLLFATLCGLPLEFNLGGLLPGTVTRITFFLVLSGVIYYGGVCVMNTLDRRG